LSDQSQVLLIKVKDSKIEIIGKFYVEKINFSSFNVLNASTPRQNFFFRLLYASIPISLGYCQFQISQFLLIPLAIVFHSHVFAGYFIRNYF